MSDLHEDELAIDAALVRRLVARSFPRYARLDVRALDSSGSSNALFRVGDELLARLPRQPGGSSTIRKEATWLPWLACGLRTAVPEVVAVGEPGLGYPEAWLLSRWIDGVVPPVPRPPSAAGGSDRLAEGLARFVVELRGQGVPPAAVGDPALSSYRGGRLGELDDQFRQSVRDCVSIPDLDLDLDRVVDVWRQALAAEQSTVPVTTWLHGDLLAENLLTRQGELVAVLDFGGLSIGDPCVDLVVAWEVLDAPGRQIFKRAVGATDAEWAAAMGWAVFIAVITFPYYWQAMPRRCVARRSMVLGVLAEA